MRHCVIIPCYNHESTVAAVAREAAAHCPVIIVDDGSIPRLPPSGEMQKLRLPRNAGKGAALRLGLGKAATLGFTHAITMDADGQHFASDIPRFLEASKEQPGALVVGIRDFKAAGTPWARRKSNAFSAFCFGAQTGVGLSDTQCGFRCYPLPLAQRLTTRSQRFAFELEFLLRAAWAGASIVGVPVKCTYSPEQLRTSHFRPVSDFARIAMMNIGLLMRWPAVRRQARNVPSDRPGGALVSLPVPLCQASEGKCF